MVYFLAWPFAGLLLHAPQRLTATPRATRYGMRKLNFIAGRQSKIVLRYKQYHMIPSTLVSEKCPSECRNSHPMHGDVAIRPSMIIALCANQQNGASLQHRRTLISVKSLAEVGHSKCIRAVALKLCLIRSLHKAANAAK